MTKNISKEIPKEKRFLIMVILLTGVFFTLLNETLLNLAIPVLVNEMDAAPSTVQWVVTGYMLIMGVFIPVSSLMIQWFTTRQLFIGSLVLFSVGSLVSGLAAALPYLFIGRFFSGYGYCFVTSINDAHFAHALSCEKKRYCYGVYWFSHHGRPSYRTATFRSHIRFFELEMALFHDAATYLSCID